MKSFLNFFLVKKIINKSFFCPYNNIMFNNYNEAFTSVNSVRSSYKKFYNWYKKQNLIALNNKNADAIKFIKNTGVTFNVYGENENKETYIPFDIIPRIITISEWNTIENGIKQRVKAINYFLNDIYTEQKILKSKVIPLDLIKGNPAFMTEMLNIRPSKGIYNHISGIDLIKTNKNEFYVLEDNVRVPSGVSYMIENRDIMLNLFPELLSKYKIKDVRNYPKELSRILKKSSPRNIKNPKIVVLTPGIYNSAYFEHAFLADQLGVELVEGKDLSVRNDHLNMKTINGWEKIDIIYRRMDDEFLDPLSLNKNSLLGIPGLMEVYRKGHITISNAPGSGISDDKAIYSYIPDIIKFYLNEKPILTNITTYKCANSKEKRYVLNNINKLVIKEVHGSGGYGMLIGPLSTKKQIEVFKNKIKSNPNKYIAQPTLSLSSCPIFSKTGLEPRHVDLRPFALLSKNECFVTPGGLTRVALKKGSLIVNSSQGGGTKDTWIVGK